MKSGNHLTNGLLLVCALLAFVPLAAQNTSSILETQDTRVKKYTVLAQYEPGLVLPAEERIQRKTDRHNLIREKRAILDTLSISDRKRKKILKELYRSPFTSHWDKMIAEIEAEDEENVENP